MSKPEPKDPERDIEQQVLNALGRPKTHAIKAVNVFSNKWRVNLWTTIQQRDLVVSSYKLTWSFFVVVDADGHITSSNPPLALKERPTIKKPRAARRARAQCPPATALPDVEPVG